jgi:hypothetical protein
MTDEMRNAVERGSIETRYVTERAVVYCPTGKCRFPPTMWSGDPCALEKRPCPGAPTGF